MKGTGKILSSAGSFNLTQDGKGGVCEVEISF